MATPLKLDHLGGTLVSAAFAGLGRPHHATAPERAIFREKRVSLTLRRLAPRNLFHQFSHLGPRRRYRA